MSAQAEWREANKDKLLTQEQVDNLQPGQHVDILWSGGNGPHRYIVDERQVWDDGSADVYVRVPNREHLGSRGRVTHAVDFVGAEKCHTQVILAGDGV